MDMLHARCAGLDVHKDTVVACARILADGGVRQRVKTFATTTTGLLALADWLSERGCTPVAMEATGVYWKPVRHILEGAFALVLANAMHVRNVPGRKTDVTDAMWIADLLAHGLIRGSFVPETSIQHLRMLTRTRKQLVRERAQHVQRIQKTLEDANLKIAAVASDIMGVSGRAILEALMAGETDPETLADLTRGRLKARRATVVDALRGRITHAHRFLLQLHLDQIRALEGAIAVVETEMGTFLEPFRAAAEVLTTMPGASDLVAQVIIAEIGVDMARFHRRAPDLLGRAPPSQRRERREASVHPSPQRRALAQDRPRPSGLVRDPRQGHLPARPVPPPQEPSRSRQGDHCCGGFHADGHVLHAARRCALP